jgi:D-glycerate 3-kinase
MEGLVRAAPVDIPVFDKGIDDRAGTRRVRGPFDVVVLEGWCVGAGPEGEAALQVPVNALEAELDPDGTWRRYVNDALAGEYARVWQSLAQLVFLRVPGLEAVRRWRLEQEQTRPRWQRLDAAEIDRFVQHYERLTRAMLATLPERADLTVDLAEDHSIASLSYRVP